MIEHLLLYPSTALCAATIFAMVRAGLLRRAPYAAFAAMQAATLIRDLVMAFIPLQSVRYTVAWEVTLPLVFVTQAYAGFACARSIAALYPKIGRFATNLFAVSLLLTFALSFAGLPFELHGWMSEPVFRSLIVCYRWTDTLLAGGLLLAVAFLSHFPRPMKRLPVNLIRHTSLLTAYFSLYAVAYFFPVSLAGSVEAVRMVAVCGLYGVWALALTKGGESSERWPGLDPAVVQHAEERYRQLIGFR